MTFTDYEDADYQSHLSELLRALKGDSPIRDVRDLETVMFSTFADYVVDSLSSGLPWNGARAVATIVERLRAPVAEYRFVVRFTPRSVP